jgi:excisionase family DNA binding protein
VTDVDRDTCVRDPSYPPANATPSCRQREHDHPPNAPSMTNALITEGRTMTNATPREPSQAPARRVPNGAAHSGQTNVVPIQRGGYSVAEVAEILAVPSTTVCAWARADLIPVRRIGRRWVIPRARFDAWLDDLLKATDADFARERRRLDRAANRRRR